MKEKNNEMKKFNNLETFSVFFKEWTQCYFNVYIKHFLRLSLAVYLLNINESKQRKFNLITFEMFSFCIKNGPVYKSHVATKSKKKNKNKEGRKRNKSPSQRKR